MGYFYEDLFSVIHTSRCNHWYPELHIDLERLHLAIYRAEQTGLVHPTAQIKRPGFTDCDPMECQDGGILNHDYSDFDRVSLPAAILYPWSHCGCTEGLKKLTQHFAEENRPGDQWAMALRWGIRNQQEAG